MNTHEKEIQKLVDAINNDLPKATETLSELSIDWARYIHDAMIANAIPTISTTAGKLRATEHRTNVGYYDMLRLADSGSLLSDIGTGGQYVHGDFHAWVAQPTRADVDTFLKTIPEILGKLAEYIDIPQDVQR